MSGTRIDEIVDAIAAAGANLGTAPNQVGAIWGMGSGKVNDPRTGRAVMAGVPGATQIESLSWFVLPPTSSNWGFGDATTTEIPRRIEGRLYMPKTALVEAYRILVGFENAFLTLFTKYTNATLSDTCAEIHVASTGYGGDTNWVWLSVVVSALEVVNFGA